MSARRLCQHCLLRIVSLWLAMPFVLLSLVAKGYMPAQAADGGLTMVICSAAGAISVTIDPETGEKIAHEAPEDGRCSWAQMALTALLPEAGATLPPVALPRAMLPVTPDDLWRPAFDPRGLFARGPPATV
ncbi:MAG TPA: hypothetical protein PLH11_04920 [Gemmobacter sp.]|nr:hypothetical protein [Gemmobacter sp.]